MRRALRRIQIREAIKAHFEKEQPLFAQGIKVLSLFFIDEVAKYRHYDSRRAAGEYAHIFEEEYDAQLNEVLTLEDTPYNHYLKGIRAVRDPRRLLLHRQENASDWSTRMSDARRGRGRPTTSMPTT